MSDIDDDRPDLPLLLRAATAATLLAAVLGSTTLAWMADAARHRTDPVRAPMAAGEAPPAPAIVTARVEVDPGER